MGEKTEKATPKKLQDAKKKGQVAKAQDLPAAFTFIASVAIILALANHLYHQLADFMVSTFRAVGSTDLTQNIIVNLFYKANEVIFFSKYSYVRGGDSHWRNRDIFSCWPSFCI